MNNIDELLKQMSKSKPVDFPFNDREIKSIFEKIDIEKKPFFIRYKGILAMSILATIVLIFISSIIWNSDKPNEQKQSQIIQQIQDKSNKIVSNEINSISKSPMMNSKVNKNSDFAIRKNENNGIHFETNLKSENTKKEELSSNNHIETENSKKEDLSSDYQIETEKVNLTFNFAPDTTQKDDLDSIDVLILNEEELNSINIKKVDCGYLFMTESSYPDYNIKNLDEILSLGYPKKGIARMIHLVNDSDKIQLSIIKNPDWSMDETPGIFPVLLNLHQGNGGRTMFISTSFGSNITKIPYIVPNNIIITGKLLNDIRKKIEPETEISSIKVYYNKIENKDLKFSVPIFLKVKSGIRTNYIMVTYLATENLIKLLPKRYKRENYDSKLNNLQLNSDLNKIRNQFQNSIAGLGDICDKLNSTKQNNSIEQSKEIKQISSIEKINLTSEEAEKVGIHFNGDTISCLFEDYINKDIIPSQGIEMISNMYGYDTTKAFILLKSNPSMFKYPNDDEHKINIMPTKYDGWDYNVWSEKAAIGIIYNTTRKVNGNTYSSTNLQISQSPLLKSDSSLNEYLEFDKIVKQDSTGKYKPIVNNLLPINISWEQILGKDTIFHQADFWYYIDKKFASNLPERYKIPILKELDIISKVDDGSLTPEDACKGLDGEVSYFGICKPLNNIANEIFIYPNPLTNNNLNLKFMLRNENYLAIELYNYDGKYLATLKDFTIFNKGMNNLSFELPDKIGAGVYFITLSDNRGNKAIEKFIKVK
jgi:hypothetical protein